MDASVLLLYITIPHVETGQKMAKVLLEKNLIACANILPAHTAIYRWEDKIQEDSEHVMILKTVADKAAAVEAEIQSMHPYECPCILQIPTSHANKDFLNWVKEQTNS